MIWLVPVLLALLLGTVGITRQAWRDEHATWHAASSSWPSLWEHLSEVDIVLAPYYVFMKGWISVFGDSVVAMRVPSVLAIAAAAGLVAVLGQRLFGRWVGLLAGALFAVLPSVSRYAQEARPYSLAIAFAVLSVLAVLRAVRDSSLGTPSWRGWALVSLSVMFTGFGHLVALLVLLAHIPIVISRSSGGALGVSGRGLGVRQVPPEDPRLFGENARIKGPDSSIFPENARILARSVKVRWAVAVGVGLLPVLPLAVLGARQTGQVSWIEASWKNLATLPMSLTRSAAVAGILAALACVGVLASRWDWRIALLLIWGGAPPLVLFLAARDLFFYRYLLFILPAWTLLAALGLLTALKERRALAASALLAVLLALSARDHLATRKSPLPGDQDYRAAAAYVSAHLASADLIFFDGYQDKRERLGFAYELRGRPAPRECAGCLDTAQRLWLVTNGHPAALPGFVAVETKIFPGITVSLLQRIP